MDREGILTKLREHERELRAAGIASLSLFGSVARGDAKDESDIDLIAEFDTAARLSLLGVIGLENRLSDILGLRADLSNRRMLKPEVLQSASREAVRVFRSPNPQLLLRDILDAIAEIGEFTAGMDLDAFQSNPMAVAAVECPHSGGLENF